ncbi:MarR family winged helix-turn-helix transcriptional regulator [Amycolatopsis magusensis]|uniref:MarR family winged helix-turn-helix transcriptional regulator n=1 Tax=Amycolatopsis magusensis TaxID=882444 RepID=UPI0037B99752
MGSPPAADAVTDAVLTASRLLVAVSVRSLAAIDEAVTLPQFRLLVVLDTRGPLKHATLAEHLGVNPSTANRMVNRLVTAGMVDRRTSPESRREIVLSLTASGTRVVHRVTTRRRAEIAKIVAKMPATHRQGLVDALTAFAAAGGEPPVHTQLDGIWPGTQ